MKAILGTILVVMLSLGVNASPTFAAERELNSPEQEFTVEILNVSPEFKAGENGTIEMNSAFVTKQNGSSDELFGSFWAEFEYGEGSSDNVYKTKNWHITDIRLAEELSAKEIAQIKVAFYEEMENLFDEIPRSNIDRILNSLDNYATAGLNTEAPRIIYTNQPSALILIDGQPYYEGLNKRYSKISNTGVFMVKDNKKDDYYMYGGGLWFTSGNALNGWEYTPDVPNRINNVMRKHARELYNNMQDEQFQAQIVPEIIITTEPAELIATDGSPKMVLIANTKLGYVENTDADLFRDLNTNKYYSLFSGRWFSSDRLEAGWQYVAPDALPADLAKIPEDHDKSNVLVSVPGTKAAENAVKDAQIPYVQQIDISTVLDTRVDYNGEPEFVQIDGTELRYAVNTSSPVLMWNDTYYLVEEAVWYNSTTPYGPWQVAQQRPEGVENIPADNPLFNVKYVYVYKQTDRVVYTGFTSGYTGSYVYGPTVVFGTGFHYHGWYNHFYYHHPMTYGYGFFYDPFYGWVPVYSPWFRSSFYWHWNWHYWYGYRPPYYPPIYNRPPRIEHYSNRPTSGVRPTQPIERPGRPSVSPDRPTTRPTQPTTRPSQPSVRPTQPATRPSQPIARPVQPSVRPVQPAARPAAAPAQMRR
ncbi:hypothetical protein OU798_09380 [Prolixibacteraceae bacterium Z1-6]|uniref:Carbohydrate-binding family V/XII n=1 Tax=Draconibacterium aestuarii TaxID=2998507 RepID=A0A9X3J636_9BACT|nr:hypothetical protein [Prolixibacteraceae bacterium Z1-6]